MNVKLDERQKKILFRAGLISLKVLALILVLEAVFVNFANKVATVLVTGETGVLSALRHRHTVASYSYISNNRYLNLSDLKVALIVLGIALYAEALLIELLINRKAAATADQWAPAEHERLMNGEPDVRTG
jgi:hypothetical protein